MLIHFNQNELFRHELFFYIINNRNAIIVPKECLLAYWLIGLLGYWVIGLGGLLDYAWMIFNGVFFI